MWACSKYFQRSKNHFGLKGQCFWGLLVCSWEQCEGLQSTPKDSKRLTGTLWDSQGLPRTPKDSQGLSGTPTTWNIKKQWMKFMKNRATTTSKEENRRRHIAEVHSLKNTNIWKIRPILYFTTKFRARVRQVFSWVWTPTFRLQNWSMRTLSILLFFSSSNSSGVSTKVCPWTIKGVSSGVSCPVRDESDNSLISNSEFQNNVFYYSFSRNW